MIMYSNDTILSGSCEDTITIDSNSSSSVWSTLLNSTMYATYPITNSGTIVTNPANYTLNATGYSQPWITTSNAVPNTLDVKGDANFEGDIKFKGRSLQELFSKIEDRLTILQPDPAKLEKYEALRKAYEHYNLLEKLIGED